MQPAGHTQFYTTLTDATLGVGIIAAVVGITVQEFLREVRIVVIAILIRGRW